MIVEHIGIELPTVVSIVGEPDLLERELSRIIGRQVNAAAELVAIFEVNGLDGHSIAAVGHEIRFGIEVDLLQAHRLAGAGFIAVLIYVQHIGPGLEGKRSDHRLGLDGMEIPEFLGAIDVVPFIVPVIGAEPLTVGSLTRHIGRAPAEGITNTRCFGISKFHGIPDIIVANTVTRDVYVVGGQDTGEQKGMGIGRHLFSTIIAILAILVLGGIVYPKLKASQAGFDASAVLKHIKVDLVLAGVIDRYAIDIFFAIGIEHVDLRDMIGFAKVVDPILLCQVLVDRDGVRGHRRKEVLVLHAVVVIHVKGNTRLIRPTPEPLDIGTTGLLKIFSAKIVEAACHQVDADRIVSGGMDMPVVD